MEERYQKSFSFKDIGKLQYFRHIVQLIVFFIINGKLFGFLPTTIIVPYLHSTQSPYSIVIGAYDALEYSISKGIFPLVILGIIYLTSVTVGRVLCGWGCPMGMIQDFLSYFPVKKRKLSSNTIKSLKDIKLVLLFYSLLVTIFVAYKRNQIEEEEEYNGTFVDSPFSVISPSSTLFTYIPWMIIWKNNILENVDIFGWIKIALFIGTLAPSVYIPRFFCRFFCPMGLLLGLTNKFKLLKIYRKNKFLKEEANKVLDDVCPMGVEIKSEEVDFIDHSDCIHCGKCIMAAPKIFNQKIQQ
jgi:ferredoxin-type protein NapH